jgi:hypothetical protein
MSGCASTKRYSMSHSPDGIPSEDTMYRVMVDNGKNCVRVQCIGMYCVDNALDGSYSGLEELPQWMQGKVALLMMTSFTPPIPEVAGVGQRISEDTFWIYD